MKEYAIRLKRGDDLKTSIQTLCPTGTAIVLSSVGCLSQIHLRMAGAKEELFLKEDFEIISLNGTISNGKAHLHLSVSDSKGNVIGGHLKEDCLINTTCELVLGILEEYQSCRHYDPSTGYDEIEFEAYNKE